MNFKLESKFKPAGDQPQAIKALLAGLAQKKTDQVLLGATGTGKTFTIAHVIKKIQRPTLVLSHNKTLAAQLYSELKSLFPSNSVEYFISNFDYYRPEAYLPSSDTYIEKTSQSNWDIEVMRMSALNSLLTRHDTVVVASVAAIYAQLSPKEYVATFMHLKVGQEFEREELLGALVARNYVRNDVELAPVDTLTGELIKKESKLLLFPADAYTTSRDVIKRATKTIADELVVRLAELKKQNKLLEVQRLEQRTNSDIESLLEFGTCPGIENYSRHLEGRLPGQRPATILDYFPADSLMVIDESHMMIPQINAMYNGDRARKETLVEYGFRLPSALDNRPLRFEEFQAFRFNRIYVSATPADYEIAKSDHRIISQIVRPTGLLDPVIEVRPTANQVEDIFNSIKLQNQQKERTIILTTTKKMAEELSFYLKERGLKIAYIHSEHKTFERDDILRKLRKGVYDAIVGVNLIREGIDIPEVSLICVVDADKESFFRSTKSLIQIIGRAARNVHGKVVFYGDKITTSMQNAIDETNRRRKIQIAYNQKHGITPQTIVKPIPAPIHGQTIDEAIEEFKTGRRQKDKKQQREFVADLRRQMLRASKELDFERAAQLRDIIIELEVEYHLDGSSIKDCVSQYTLLTGRIKGVPDLAYGVWLNRLYYHNAEQLWEQIQLAQKNAYPLDVITLDPKWLKDRYVKSCNFELNESVFGVRFVKPDYGDGVPKNAFVSSRQFGGTLRQWFIYLYLRCCYEASLEYFGDGQALIFARPGFIGTQKFVGLSGALAGHVIWGTDIGGFAGPQPSEDLYQRWTQFGMLTPLSRYHGIGAREP
ncbi:uncharacterized protein LOC111616426 [Centruroides sculpturatus]|uniref:uncharacterized protein LOC111616426 n=1 Tax=Centruroides sculpturatus TaxID=218467 RepID=UPI000C6E64A4|nr:uncharacterized protein LOC111616426 [Centruroides sculpturatus]